MNPVTIRKKSVKQYPVVSSKTITPRIPVGMSLVEYKERISKIVQVPKIIDTRLVIEFLNDLGQTCLTVKRF